MSVLAAIAVLALLIVVHELGHFMAARLQGIHVNRFSIGFGPVLWSYQGKETEYAIRAIPLGGFVGFPDDDPDSDIPPSDPNLLKNRPILDRAIVISAGVIANLIFAYLVFVTQFAGVGVPVVDYNPGLIVDQVIATDSPAARAGLQGQDVILAIDNQALGQGQEAQQAFISTIQNSPSQPVPLTVKRGDRELELTVTPELQALPLSGFQNFVETILPGQQYQPEESAIIGIKFIPNIQSGGYRSPEGIVEVLKLAAVRFQDTLLQVLNGFFLLLTNFSEVSSEVAGPVKIVEQGAQFASNDASNLFPFTAIISINLAIINILPLPALDGGQLVFLLLEGLRGKPLPNRIQENVMQTGLVLLLGLGVFLIVRDTTQLEVFQRLFQ